MARPGLLQHPKFRRLVHTMREPVPHILGYLECLWQVAYECGQAVIGDAVDVELAAQFPGEPGKLTAALVGCGLIDTLEGGRYQVHDLYDHAPDYVLDRARREGERKKEKKCSRCGIIYRSTDPRSKFCRDACRQADYRERHQKQGELCYGPLRTVTDSDGTPAPAPAPIPKKGDESPLTPLAPSRVAASEPTPSAPGINTAAAPEEPQQRQEDPAALIFPVVGGKRGKGPTEWPLRQSKLAEYAESFPGVDVLAECRKALQWCRDNPAKRKTPSGMSAFLGRWLGKAQNGARTGRLPAETPPERMARLIKEQQCPNPPPTSAPGPPTTSPSSGSTPNGTGR